MSIQAVGTVLEMDVPHVAAKMLLISMANAHNPSTGLCCPSMNRLAKEAGMSRSSVKRWMKWLTQEGYVEVQHQHGDDARQKANIYVLLFIDRGSNMTPVQSDPRVTGEPLPRSTGEPLPRSNCEPPIRNGNKKPKEEPKEERRNPKGTLSRFDELWKIFPRRSGSSEDDALKVFCELDEKAQVKCLDYAARFRRHTEKLAKQFDQTYEERCKRVPYLSNWIERGDWLAAKSLPPDPGQDPKIRQAMATQKVINRNRETQLFEACERAQGKAAPSSVDAWAFPNQVIDQARGMIHG
jgi:hypothetical protein